MTPRDRLQPLVKELLEAHGDILDEDSVGVTEILLRTRINELKALKRLHQEGEKDQALTGTIQPIKGSDSSAPKDHKRQRTYHM